MYHAKGHILVTWQVSGEFAFVGLLCGLQCWSKGWWLKAVCAWHENVKHGRLREGNQQGLSGLFFPVSAFWYTQAPQKSCVSKGKLHFIISIYCPFLLLVCLIRCIRVFLKNECNSKKKKSDMGPEVFFVDNHYKVNYWTCWCISFCTSAVGITAIFALTACTLAYTMCTGFLTLCRKGSPLTWISL